MTKPTKRHHHDPCYDYGEVIDYIEAKYNINTREYKEDLDGEYRNFWHYVLESNGNNISDGSYGLFPDFRDSFEDDDDWWVREIMELIVAEFFPDEDEDDYSFYVEG